MRAAAAAPHPRVSSSIYARQPQHPSHCTTPSAPLRASCLDYAFPPYRLRTASCLTYSLASAQWLGQPMPPTPQPPTTHSCFCSTACSPSPPNHHHPLIYLLLFHCLSCTSEQHPLHVLDIKPQCRSHPNAKHCQTGGHPCSPSHTCLLLFFPKRLLTDPPSAPPAINLMTALPHCPLSIRPHSPWFTRIHSNFHPLPTSGSHSVAARAPWRPPHPIFVPPSCEGCSKCLCTVHDHL